jgi:hypothetical protein
VLFHVLGRFQFYHPVKKLYASLIGFRIFEKPAATCFQQRTADIDPLTRELIQTEAPGIKCNRVMCDAKLDRILETGQKGDITNTGYLD